jgi:two-component system response regulator FixJ
MPNAASEGGVAFSGWRLSPLIVTWRSTARLAGRGSPDCPKRNNMPTTGNVYVVDDDESMCALIEQTLKQVGLNVKSYPSAEAFAEVMPNPGTVIGPCCLLLDLVMPGQSGLEFLERRLNREIPCPVIMMTARGSVHTAVKSMKLGAADFLEKPFAPDDLKSIVFEALEKCARGGEQETRRQAVRAKLARLSPRERELLDAIALGSSTKMIANRLGISARTVDHHRANLMAKMEANNVADLVRMAVEADYRSAGKPA